MTQVRPAQNPAWRTPAIVMTAGCLIAMIGFGVRATFGLFLEPMTVANGWDRETYALAMALQNLTWGLCLPLAGALTDRYGPQWVLAVGAVVYAAGVWGMSLSDSGFTFQFTGGILTGIGVALTSFTIAATAMAKAVGPEKRSLALGLGTAAGSAGQVVFSPVGQGFISAFGWEAALLYLAAIGLLIVGLAFVLPNDTAAKGEDDTGQTLATALREAAAHRGYILLALGFFVCGFQIAFITIHFPAYVKDLGLPASVGAYSIAIVGLFNIVGSLLAGVAGQRWSKKCSLSVIYFVRAIAIIALLFAPKTVGTVYLFSAVMGLFWLATVPLTSGLVAQVFGARYLATLFGIVFLAHQLGSFLGVWLGGYFFDTTGSYDVIWWLSVALSFGAAIIHLPINEKPLPRLSPAAVG